ncbi:hypothetical protein [Chitinophaga pinensis]
MSIFIAALAYTAADWQITSKTAIIATFLSSGLIGYSFLKRSARPLFTIAKIIICILAPLLQSNAIIYEASVHNPATWSVYSNSECTNKR